MENDSIAANVKRIMEALPPGVILVAAAKARTPEEVEAALRAGVTHVGHNYIQEAERMIPTIGAGSEGRAFAPDAVFAQRESSPCPSYWVNSLHHQAIKDVAPGLTVAARAPDDVIEAVEVEGHPFAIGVQWHPEELAATFADVRAQRIFDALVEACQGLFRDRLS